MSRTYSLVTVLGVIAVSIVFGMVIGGRLNAPAVMLAAPERSLHDSSPSVPVAPAMVDGGRYDFADVAETAIPAVVSIANLQVTDGKSGDGTFEFFHRFFFQDQDEDDDAEGQGPERDSDPGAEQPDRKRHSNTFGSGFLITEDGYILSNNHVVEGSDALTVVLQDGSRYHPEIIGSDPGIDLALLKIDPAGRKMPYLPLGDSDTLRVGEWVIAIGNPLDFNHSVTVGVVSAKDRRVPLEGTDIGVAAFIQTDAAINLGNSGGPLLNARGEVVGINTAINRSGLAEGIGFALQIDDAKTARDQLVRTGEVRRGILGVSMSGNPIDDEIQRYYDLPDRDGVLIERVEPDSPADRAGIEPEDIIRKVDGKVIRRNPDLLEEIASRLPGDEVELEIFRSGQTVTTHATLAPRKVDRFGRPFIGTSETDLGPETSIVMQSGGLGLTVETYDAEQMPAGRGRNADPELRGVIVTAVDLNSVAMDRGLKRDMIIVSFNDLPVHDASDWRRLLDDAAPGSTVKLGTRTPAGDPGRLYFLTVPE